MKDFEQWLANRVPVEPSEDLNRRMDQLFAGFRGRPNGFWFRPIPLWQSAAACVLFALCGFWVDGGRSEPEPRLDAARTTVYIIQPGPEIPRHAFDATARESVFLGHSVEPQVRPMAYQSEDLTPNSSSL